MWRRHSCWFVTYRNTNTEQSWTLASTLAHSHCYVLHDRGQTWQYRGLALICIMLQWLLWRACGDMVGVHCFQCLTSFNNHVFHFCTVFSVTEVMSVITTLVKETGKWVTATHHEPKPKPNPTVGCIRQTPLPICCVIHKHCCRIGCGILNGLDIFSAKAGEWSFVIFWLFRELHTKSLTEISTGNNNKEWHYRRL